MKYPTVLHEMVMKGAPIGNDNAAKTHQQVRDEKNKAAREELFRKAEERAERYKAHLPAAKEYMRNAPDIEKEVAQNNTTLSNLEQPLWDARKAKNHLEVLRLKQQANKLLQSISARNEDARLLHGSMGLPPSDLYETDKDLGVYEHGYRVLDAWNKAKQTHERLMGI